MNDQTTQPGRNPPADLQAELFQLAAALRDLIAEAVERGGNGAVAEVLTRAQSVAGMLVSEIANTPLRVAESPKAGETEAALALLERDDMDAAYAMWLGEPHRFATVDPAADDARAGLMRLATVYWDGLDQQTRTLGELLDRALQPENAGKERIALQGAKSLVVLQYRQAFNFCETVQRLIEGRHER